MTLLTGKEFSPFLQHTGMVEYVVLECAAKLFSCRGKMGRTIGNEMSL